MCLINELYAGLIGGSLPTLRGRPALAPAGEKTGTAFYFQVIHPDAISGGAFAQGRDQMENLKAVLQDVFGHGNEGCILPGQFEAQARKRSDDAGGLHFTAAELEEFKELAEEVGAAPLVPM
jgi:L-2-hydroxycarboxylate dehydrogenase (NAD+)